MDKRKEMSVLFNEFHTLSVFFFLCLLLYKHTYFVKFFINVLKQMIGTYFKESGQRRVNMLNL